MRPHRCDLERLGRAFHEDKTLEVGVNERAEVVINHRGVPVDEEGVGHIIFTPKQARELARVLLIHADRADRQQPEHN